MVRNAMAEPASFKYRALISFSHAAATWAGWLHRALETFRIDLASREKIARTEGEFMSANARIAAFAVVLSVVSLCGYAPPASSQDSNEGNSDDHGFKGIIAPARSYDIAPPFDGQVIEIHFKPGEYVDKGKLLFTLDTTKEELELERDKAQLSRAEAQLRIAEVTLKKNEELRKKNVISELRYLELEAQRDIAAAAATEAGVQVRGDEIKITETKLYAPFAGVMSRPTVAEGAHLSEQTTMATLSELDPILIKAYVPYQVYAEHLQLLEPGETFDRSNALDGIEVSVTLPTGQKLPQIGRLAGGGYEFDPQTQVMEVLVEIPNPNLLLRPGLAVTLVATRKPE
jgi:RND family efflux transporter MFP subunit